MTAMIREPLTDPARLNRVGDPDRPGMRRGRRLFKWLLGSDPHPTPGQMASIRQAMLAGDPLADAVVAMYHRLPAARAANCWTRPWNRACTPSTIRRKN